MPRQSIDDFRRLVEKNGHPKARQHLSDPQARIVKWGDVKLDDGEFEKEIGKIRQDRNQIKSHKNAREPKPILESVSILFSKKSCNQARSQCKAHPPDIATGNARDEKRNAKDEVALHEYRRCNHLFKLTRPQEDPDPLDDSPQGTDDQEE